MDGHSDYLITKGLFVFNYFDHAVLYPLRALSGRIHVDTGLFKHGWALVIISSPSATRHD